MDKEWHLPVSVQHRVCQTARNDEKCTITPAYRSYGQSVTIDGHQNVLHSLFMGLFRFHAIVQCIAGILANKSGQ